MGKTTLEQYRAYMNKGHNKYRNIKTNYNGILYDSKAEAHRAMELNVLEQAGIITNLERQPRFPIIINEVKVFTYIADFKYLDTRTGKEVVEDVKGMRSGAAWNMFSLKKKCVEAYYKIEIQLI